MSDDSEDLTALIEIVDAFMAGVLRGVQEQQKLGQFKYETLNSIAERARNLYRKRVEK
jgi:hypothetical protein